VSAGSLVPHQQRRQQSTVSLSGKKARPSSTGWRNFIVSESDYDDGGGGSSGGGSGGGGGDRNAHRMRGQVPRSY
jgi:hypothetical protein